MKRPLHLTALAFLLALPVIACGGSGADIPALATAAADVAPASSFNVAAKGTKYDTDTLVVASGLEVVINFDNRDSALHNISVFSLDGDDAIYRGELFTGPESMEYRFEAPAAGVYYFHCDAHPEMKGVFVSR